MTNKVIQKASDRITADFSGSPLKFLGLRFLPASEWDKKHPGEYSEKDLACLHGGHEFAIAATEATSVELLSVKIASTLQDDAMDELNAPWPALELDGQFYGILEPQLDADNHAIWSCKGFACPIGQLKTFVAAGLITQALSR